MTTAPWLAIARQHIGTKEFKGAADNPAILKWFRYSGLPEKFWHDSTAWCSVFACACVEQAGYKSSRNAMARSWLNAGTKCEPKPGAIVVLPRGKPPSGHVAIVESVDHAKGTFTSIDGNVADQVKRVTRKIDRALGFRWPVKRALPHAVDIETAAETTKEATKTAAKSKSVWLQAAAMFWIIWGWLTDGLDWLFSGILSVVGAMPDVGSEIETHVLTSQKFAGWLGIPWGKVSLGLVVALMVIVAARHVRDKMQWSVK